MRFKLNLRRLQFRIRHLFVLTIVVAVTLSFWSQLRQNAKLRGNIADQAKEIGTLKRQIDRLQIEVILKSDMSDKAKAEALSPYVALGDPIEKIETTIGEADIYPGSAGYSAAAWMRLGLILRTYPSGEICQIDYIATEKNCNLAQDDPITWPKTPQPRDKGKPVEPEKWPPTWKARSISQRSGTAFKN